MADTTRLGLGCAPIGNLYSAVTDTQAADTVDAAWEHGIRLFDTAPLYGYGLSERRLGDALRDRPRDEFTIATKVGRRLDAIDNHSDSTGPAHQDSIFADTPAMWPQFDYSRDGILRSIDDSLERLGLDHLDIVHVHDPDDHIEVAMNEAFPTLIELRDSGVIGAVGCGMNNTAPLLHFVERVDLDVILLAGRYSLLDPSGGDELLPACAARGVDVIIGGVFNSGLLADPDANTTFDYAAAPAALVERVRNLRSICESFGVTLPMAAVGFALRNPAVSSVLVGARSRSEVIADVAAADADLPPDLWQALEIGCLT